MFALKNKKIKSAMFVLKIYKSQVNSIFTSAKLPHTTQTVTKRTFVPAGSPASRSALCSCGGSRRLAVATMNGSDEDEIMAMLAIALVTPEHDPTQIENGLCIDRLLQLSSPSGLMFFSSIYDSPLHSFEIISE